MTNPFQSGLFLSISGSIGFVLVYQTGRLWDICCYGAIKTCSALPGGLQHTRAHTRCWKSGEYPLSSVTSLHKVKWSPDRKSSCHETQSSQPGHKMSALNCWPPLLHSSTPPAFTVPTQCTSLQSLLSANLLPSTAERAATRCQQDHA